MNKVPRDLYIDLAGLADYEVEAGAPLAWPSYAEPQFLRSIGDARDSEDLPLRPMAWLRLGGVIVRWGDPRINQVLEYWRSMCEQYESSRNVGNVNGSEFTPAEWAERERRQSIFELYGKRLIVVLPTMIYTTQIIPKALGIPDPDDDDGRMISEVFDPMICHHGQAKVFGWDLQTDRAADFLNITFGSGPMVYLDVEHYCFQLEFGLPIDRTILSTVEMQPQLGGGEKVIHMS